jgi:hypothetical protein
MELPNWPPAASGSVDWRKIVFAISPQEVIIDAVTRLNGKEIAFVCKLDGGPHKYFFRAPDEKIAEKLNTILWNNIGMSLLSIGSIEIPPELSY